MLRSDSTLLTADSLLTTADGYSPVSFGWTAGNGATIKISGFYGYKL